MFELTNDQRKILGLQPVEPHWDAVRLREDRYRPESLVYYDGNRLVKHIVSTADKYAETQYSEETSERRDFVPKTQRGTLQRISAATLERKSAIGVYFFISNNGHIRIANHTSQTTFYDSSWERLDQSEKVAIPQLIEDFIRSLGPENLKQLDEFKTAIRKHEKFAPGDFFALKIGLNEFAFGRILADVGRLRPQADLHRNHGLWNIMTKPVLVTIYGHIAASSNANLDEIMKSPKLPSDYMMDNQFFFGEYQIVGHRDLVPEDLDFPMSYGGTLRKSPNVFLQWGLIHKELPRTENTRYLTVRNDRVPAGNPNEIITNPYGYYGIGFRTRYDAEDVRRTSELGRFDYDNSVSYSARLDLRNPRNSRIRADLMNEFGLRPDLDYVENCGLTGTMNVEDLLKILNSRPNSRNRN